MFSLSSKRILIFVFLASLATSAFGHSQMRCAKYNKATGACAAPIRNQAVSFLQEAYTFSNGAPICQSPMTNPISAAYANGAGCPDWASCPAPMGTYTPGEQFTVMWFARNHAVENQNPATIRLYLSPKQSATQGQDVSQSTMSSNLICSGPYMNCGGVNQDQTPCTADCTMPGNTQPGIYTLWWKWDWQGTMYTTCADVVVTGSSNPTPSPPTPTPPTPSPPTPTPPTPTPPTPSPPTPTPPSPVPAATTGRSTTGRSTTGRSTTGSAPVATTGSASNPTPTPSTTGSAAGGTTCTLGHQKCTSMNTYQTCGWATSTITGWGRNQTCPAGLKCNPVQGNFVWCF